MRNQHFKSVMIVYSIKFCPVKIYYFLQTLFTQDWKPLTSVSVQTTFVLLVNFQKKIVTQFALESPLENVAATGLCPSIPPSLHLVAIGQMKYKKCLFTISTNLIQQSLYELLQIFLRLFILRYTNKLECTSRVTRVEIL